MAVHQLIGVLDVPCESWQRALRQNRWESSWQAGRDFSGFLELEHTTASVMTYLLKLKG
jgi:putative tricarboxylic transport membrane protein